MPNAACAVRSVPAPRHGSRVAGIGYEQHMRPFLSPTAEVARNGIVGDRSLDVAPVRAARRVFRKKHLIQPVVFIPVRIGKLAAVACEQEYDLIAGTNLLRESI